MSTRDGCLCGLASFALSPRDVVIWARHEVPRLASGKVDFRTLLTDCIAHAQHRVRDTPASTPLSPEATLAALLSGYRDFFSGVAVVPSDSFVSLNGDSLGYVQISILVEELLGHLPDDWESKPISELGSLIKSQGHHGLFALAEIETGVLIRVLAPLAVVLNHAGHSALHGGAALLMLVSGQQFARFQSRNLFERRFARTASNVLKNILLPYWCVLLGFQLSKRDVSFPDLLLVGNVVSANQHLPFGTWFIQALCQALVLLFLLFRIPVLRNWGRRQPYQAGLLFFCLSAVARVLDGLYWQPSHPTLGGGDVGWVLWLFALGFTLHFSRTVVQRVGLSLPLLAAPALFYAGDWSRMLFVSLGALWLLWLPRVSVPAMTRRGLATLGASSLFIYMLHPRARIDLLGLDWSVDVLRIATGVALGVVGWKLYTVALRYVLAGWHRFT